MIDIIKKVIATPCNKAEEPEFEFDTSTPEALQESAEKNWIVLAKHGLWMMISLSQKGGS